MNPKLPQDDYVALIGNPNSGKTAIFNLLTGANQKVSNYPGITVERKIGRIKYNFPEAFENRHRKRFRHSFYGRQNHEGNKHFRHHYNGVCNVLDLPGTYSLTPESIDERVVAEQVLDWLHGINRPSAIISVVDATNLSRNLYLTTQLLDLGIPVILALNMMDLVKNKAILPDLSDLKSKFGFSAVVPMSALEGWGIKELKYAIKDAVKMLNPKKRKKLFESKPEIHDLLKPLSDYLKKQFDYSPRVSRVQALRLITRQSAVDLYRPPHTGKHEFSEKIVQEIEKIRDKVVQRIESAGLNHRTLEANIRYTWLDNLLGHSDEHEIAQLKQETISEKIDKVLTHHIVGPIIFVSLLILVFQSIFAWSTYPMDWIDNLVGLTGDWVLRIMAPGILRDLTVEGIISGVGAVIIFLPQILILVFFMTLLEDSGYMSRVAFMLDKFMTKVGLHGRSVFPLMSGYACAIPGIMASRTIDGWKQRLITIMVLPLISCSARLPVYTLMIGAFIPARKILGIVNLQGLTLVFMYFLGTFAALVIAKILSKFIKEKGQSSFVMELPPYRIPLMRSVTRQVYLRGKIFLLNAGRIILAATIVLWFLASFPKDVNQNKEVNPIHYSYAGKIGHAIEPLIEPLGFDWKLGVGLVMSIAAREVIISTLATLYNIEGDGEDMVKLSESMQNDVNIKTGKSVYSPLVALSLMVFFVFAAQCLATIAIVKQETNSWRWPFIMITYMTALAYVASFFVYQGGRLIGL